MAPGGFPRGPRMRVGLGGAGEAMTLGRGAVKGPGVGPVPQASIAPC